MINYLSPFLLFVFNILCFLWVFKLKDKLRMAIYGIIILFLYVYCALGTGFEPYGAIIQYKAYYVMWCIVFSLSLYYFYKHDWKINDNGGIYRFSEKYHVTIIFIYYMMVLLPLISNGHLSRLWSPPSPDLVGLVADRDYSKSGFSNIASSLSVFVLPLYLLSIGRYIKTRPWLFTFLFLTPYYIEYCDVAYMGRNTMAVIALILFVIYYRYEIFNRKMLVSMVIMGVPAVIIFFVAYSYIRQGNSAGSISFGDAIEILLNQETTYYQWFDDIMRYKNYDIFNYLMWFITLPLPGFMKDGLFSINSYAFSMYVLGADAGSLNNIVLPGLVGESVFNLGPTMFFLHPLMLSIVISLLYNTLRRDESNFMVLAYILLSTAAVLGRGGLASGLAMPVKVLTVYFLFNLFTKRKII